MNNFSATLLCIIFTTFFTPIAFGQSEEIFPAPRPNLDKVIVERLEPYLVKFSVYEKLSSDLRSILKERISGQFSETCKGTIYANHTFLEDLFKSTKFDSKLDSIFAQTNVVTSALGFATFVILEEFEAANFGKTKIALDAIPSNEISKLMFYKWIGLEITQNGSVFRGYTKEFDKLALRFLNELCKK